MSVEEQEYVDMPLIPVILFNKKNYCNTENNLYPQCQFNQTLDHALF
jgi:hypothetical protein